MTHSKSFIPTLCTTILLGALGCSGDAARQEEQRQRQIAQQHEADQKREQQEHNAVTAARIELGNKRSEALHEKMNLLQVMSGDAAGEIHERHVRELDAIEKRVAWLQKQIDYIDAYSKLPPDTLITENEK